MRYDVFETKLQKANTEDAIDRLLNEIRKDQSPGYMLADLCAKAEKMNYIVSVRKGTITNNNNELM